MPRQVPRSRRPASLRAYLMAAGMTSITLAPTQSLWAQDATSSAASTVALRDYAVPAGPLDAAIVRFAQQSGLTISAEAAVTAGRRSLGVQGRLGARQALDRLLQGSGVGAVPAGGSAFTLRALPPIQGGGTTTLEPVTVVARSESAFGPADGYVATQSAVATKTDTPILETARSISVVTRDQLTARNVQSIPEAVRYTAGVTTGAFGFDPRFDQIYIRGFAVNTTGDYRDGLRQGAGSYTYFNTEPYGLERIDVIKGPASVLYGQGTPGGLINRVSKMPTDTPLREVEVQGGNHDRYQGAFDVGGPLGDSGEVSYRVTGLARDAKAIRNIEDDRLFLAPAMTWRPSAKTELTVLAQVQKDETDSNVGLFNRDGRATHTRVSDGDYDYQKQTQYQVGYRLSHQANDTWTFRQNARYGLVNQKARYLTSAGVIPGTSSINRSAVALRGELDTFVIDNQAQANFATGAVSHKTLMGVDYQWIQSSLGQGTLPARFYPTLDIDNPAIGASGPTPDITSKSGTRIRQTGVYASDQMALDRWRFSLGARFDNAQRDQRNLLSGVATGRQTDNAMTYQAGALYLFDNGLAPYVSYSTSFNPTTAMDINGSALDPTRGQQVEAGVKFQPQGARSFVTLSTYQLTERDAVRAIPGTTASEAVGKLRSRGIEIEGTANLTSGLDLLVAYNYNRAKIVGSNSAAELGKTPAVTPRHVASAWLDYTQPTGMLAGLGAGAGVRYTSDTFTTSGNIARNPSNTFIDAAIHYDLGRNSAQFKGWRVALNAQNLFDRDDQVCNAGFCYRGQGRTVIGSLRYRW